VLSFVFISSEWKIRRRVNPAVETEIILKLYEARGLRSYFIATDWGGGNTPHCPHSGLNTECMGLWHTAYGELSHAATILELTKKKNIQQQLCQWKMELTMLWHINPLLGRDLVANNGSLAVAV
jgi:hypothetical protein